MPGGGKTLHSSHWKCGVGAFEDVAGTRQRRQPTIFCGPRRRHHGAQAGGRGALRERRSLPRHGRQLPDDDVGDRRRGSGSVHEPVVPGIRGDNRFMNRSCREFAGTTYEQEISKWQLPLHPDDAPEYAEAFHCAVREHTSFRAEARVRRADGEWRLLGCFAEPRLSPGGAYLGHIGLSSDITDRRRAEDALRESEERFRTMADGCPAAMWVTNAEGGIQFINRAYQELVGATFEQVEGTKWQA